MPGQRVIVGSGESEVVFNSKAEARAYCKAILSRYRNGQEVNESDSRFLRDLLERHPEAAQKIGGGVKRFLKKRTDQGTDCFWLERENGSLTDFSYFSCVDAHRKSLYQEFAEACRQAVQPDLDVAKKEHFRQRGNSEGKVPCDLTGEMVALYESHLDHKKPMTFQVIVETFIKLNNVVIRPEMLSIPQDTQFVTTFADQTFQRQFRDHHRKLAVLRIVKITENLKLAGSDRLTTPKNPVLLKREGHDNSRGIERV